MPSPHPLRPWLAALVGLGLLAAAVAAAWLVRFDDDPLAALPADDPEVQAFREAATPFGALDTLLVGVERDDLFSRDSLERLRAFTRKAAVVPGVAEAVCFTEVPLVRASTAKTELADLVPRPVPEDPGALAEVRENVLTNDLVVGRLVSADGRAALLPIRLDPDARPQRDTAREISDLAHRMLEGGRVYVDGAPGAALAVATAQTSAALLVALAALAALLLAPALLLRRFVPVLLALVATGVAAGAGLLPAALLGWMLAPSALVAIVGAAGVALLLAAWVLVAPDPAAARARAAGRVVQGALASAAVAGLSLVLSGDLVAALVLLTGTLAALLLAVAVLPAFAGRTPEREAALPATVPEARPLLAALLTILFAAAYLGVPRLRVSVEPDEAFPPGSAPRLAEDFLRRNFGGSATLVAAVRGDAATPEALDALRALEAAGFGDPDVLEVLSLLGPARVAGRADGRSSELPSTAHGVRRFLFLAGDQPGLGQLVLPDADGVAAFVKLHPEAGTGDAVRLRDALAGAVPGGLRYAPFADADPAAAERMTAELLDRLSLRLARLGIPADRRSPGLLRDLLERIEAASGPDLELLRTRIAEHFLDGTTYVLVKDLETNEPLAMGEEEVERLAQGLGRAETIDEATVREALVEVFPGAAEDAEGLEAEAQMLQGTLDRVQTTGAGRSALPAFVEAWAAVETASEGEAKAAETELLRAASELRHGGMALPAGDGLPLRLTVGGMPLAAASVRVGAVRSLTRAFLAAALLGLALWTCLLLVGEFGESEGLLRCLSRAIPPTIVPLAATSLAFGGAGFLGLPVDPGLPATFAAALAVAGTLGALLVIPGFGGESGVRTWADGRRVALHLGPALAALGLGLSLIPLPPARTLGLLLAVSFLAAVVLGLAHGGRRA